MLLFSVVSMMVLYLIQRRAGIPAVQSAEVRRSESAAPGVQHGRLVHHQYQLAGLFGRIHHELLHPDGRLAYHNFVSAAVGIALAIAFIRGIARRQMETIGNFWVDLVRCCLWVLCRSALWERCCWFRKAWCRICKPYDTVKLVEPQQVPKVDRRQAGARTRR